MSDQRLCFVHSVRNEGLTVSAACRRFGISRPTGYEILRRFDEFGTEGLNDRSRTPLSNPRAVPDCVSNAIIRFKGDHPWWGPKKLRARLLVLYPDTAWPVVSTFGRILDSIGLVYKSGRNLKPPRLGELTDPDRPNRVWSADFKGQFRLEDGPLCFPLTVTDNYSRYLLRCRGLPDVTGAKMWPIMVGAFREHGLPDVLRIDNGNPFATPSGTGLSRFQVNLIKLGVTPERIDPGAPQQNGRHERMHRTLKAEATSPPANTMRGQQAVFDAWRREYNEERPHEALDMATPASLYSRSPRTYPKRLPDLEYDDGMDKRKVRSNGCLKLSGRDIFISETLAGEVLGIAPIDDAHSAVYVGFLAVAVINVAAGKLLDGKHAVAHLKAIRASLRSEQNGAPRDVQ